MNKFDRVISSLILLQSRKVIQAKTLSEHFDISLRTVYRDIATLKNAGIPIIGDPGIGYSIMDGYRLPPVMFDEGEASALLTAEKFIGKFTDDETQAYYSQAMTKIRATLRSTEKEAMDVLENSIIISKYNKAGKSYLQDIFRGVSARQIIELKYTKADGSPSERKIESIGCYHHLNNWYLVAYCQLKQDYRTFKINRISELRVLQDQFETKHISLQDYIDQQDDSWKSEHQLQTMRIAFSHAYLKFAESRKYYFGFVEESIHDDSVHMTFLNSSIEYMARWLIQFGNQVKILEPEELKDRMTELATELFSHYK